MHTIARATAPTSALTVPVYEARNTEQVTYLLCNNVNPAPMTNRPLNDVLHCLSDSHITQQAQAILMPAFHLLHAIFERPPDRDNFIAMAESCPYQRAANVTGCAEDLEE